MQELAPDRLLARLRGDNSPAAAPAAAPLLLLDVREAWEYAAGHIPGAAHAPLSRFPAFVEAALADTAQPLVCICEHGVRSRAAAAYLERLGYTRVENMTGGMSRWSGPREEGWPGDGGAGESDGGSGSG